MNDKIQSTDKFNTILKSSVNLPGVKIKRDDFLRRELSIRFNEQVVEEAIEHNPAKAGITAEEIKMIANECIKRETYKVTAISTVAGIPGGIAMLGTIPADMAQYFAHMIRVLQKLIYLYGWKELYNKEDDFDDATMNVLTLFMGVMFGVSAANKAIVSLAGRAAIQLEKTLVSKALTKGMVYPVIKKVAANLGYRMTKQIFAKGISKVVPIVGGIASGGLTYLTYKPSAERLQKHLIALPNADVEFYKKLITE
jgi:hypothetical protein